MENETNNPLLLIQKPQEMIRLFEQMIDQKLKAFVTLREQSAPIQSSYETTDTPFLSSRQVQIIFNVSRQTINDWRKSELLKSFKIKSRRYFFKEQVEQLRRQMHPNNSTNL